MNSKERKRLERVNREVKQSQLRIGELEDRRFQLMRERDDAQQRVRTLEKLLGTLSRRSGSNVLQYTVAIDEMHVMHMRPDERIALANSAIRRMMDQLNEKYPPHDTWVRMSDRARKENA